MKYQLHHALWQDMESGSIWLQEPVVTSRTVVKVTHQGRVLYCEAKRIDAYLRAYFLKEFAEDLGGDTNPLLMNAWYRKRLGLEADSGEVELDIQAAENPWGRFFACLHHPQLAVRLATWLATWSVLLAVLGIILAFR